MCFSLNDDNIRQNIEKCRLSIPNLFIASFMHHSSIDSKLLSKMLICDKLWIKISHWPHQFVNYSTIYTASYTLYTYK